MNECTGHEGYLVGGAVRDMLLGGKPKDFDILTTATPMQVLAFPDTIFSLQHGKLGRSARALCSKGIPLGDACSGCNRLPASVSTSLQH